MGVQGLWELLAPVGRRVSVETLAGKRLAIDASIWMIQFMKAMRDEKGEMVRNAHLIGFFRRICKLLYLRTKPVFVFDGGTPALKRRTVVARRRQRENAQAKIRKTAEKLLLNRVMRAQVVLREIEMKSSVVAEDGVDIVTEGLTKNDSKGKSVLLDEDDLVKNMKSNPERDTAVLMKDYQEKLDEMLAASLAAEEDGNLTSNASTSAAAIPSEEEGSDEDEQLLLPAMDRNIDPAVLASLPPSMQLDLLVQMRERLMAENRQKYQKVKKAPEKFSELQIQAYLKTVAFRREINEVQRAAAGRGVGGIQTSKIASEANREFIFSSSFSGDKEVLASARVGGNGENQQNTPKQTVSVSVERSSSLNKSNAATDGDMDGPRNHDEDIEVYLDERGRFRIRNRHMGIRMTRDIQRNLDLMKEKEKASSNSISNNDEIYSAWENFPTEDQFLESLLSEKVGSANLNSQDEDSMPQNTSPLEISFEDDGGRKGLDDDDDDIFLQLAAGGPVTINSTKNNNKEEFLPDSSDSDWEEMPVEQKASVPRADCDHSNQHILQVVNTSEMGAAEREETTCADPKNSPGDISVKQLSKSYLEEEADLQEAIKRSLLDLDNNTSNSLSSKFDAQKESGTILLGKNHKVGVNQNFEKPTQHTLYSLETLDVDGVEGEGNADKLTTAKAIPLNDQLDGAIDENIDGQRGITSHFDAHLSSGFTNVEHYVDNEVLKAKSAISFEKASNVASDSGEQPTMIKQFTEKSSHSFGGVFDKSSDMFIADEKKFCSLAEASSHASVKKVHGDNEFSSVMENKRNDAPHEFHGSLAESRDSSGSVLRSHIEILSYDTEPKDESREEKNTSENLDEEGTPAKSSEANLEEEIRILNEEFISLGNEQRRLERNAESVSSEMFVECQELLQIFGLPYIIAPMEAEAQCAFMEQLNLVDGIVTDDSDVFLFGARNVYKNIFDDRKYVETYFMKDVEKELGMTREKLIRMALLLGSDYTEGVSGIGIVNAIEVLNAFPEEDGLQKFREWVESPDPTILGKTDAKAGSSIKKRGSVPVDDKGSVEGGSTEDTQEIKQIFMDKHRKVSKNWHIPSTFPSDAVISAYVDPQVDQSTDPFSWGKPDLSVLQKLCWEKFGWNSNKTDDLLLPVLKEYEKRETQLRMEAFYSFSERFAKIRSKRIKKAVKGITGTMLSETTDDILHDGASSGKNEGVASVERGDNTSDKDSIKAEKGEENQRSTVEKSARKRKQSTKQERRNLTRSLEVNRRGRGRGSGSGQKRGRGRGRKDIAPQLKESSSDNEDTGYDLLEHHDIEPGSLQKVRRSSRILNPVKYNVNEDDAMAELQIGKESPSESSEEEFHITEDRFGKTSAEYGGRKQNEKAITSTNDCASEDYIQMGGGFCTDEAEIGEPSMSLNEDLHIENKPSDDYLMAGGGFCVEEDERSEDKKITDAPTEFSGDDIPGGLDTVDESDSDRLQSLAEDQTYKKKVKRPSEDLPAENDTVEVGTSSVGGLCAMPFLKRKKRRNC
ncbi:PREDICTED: DNA repair protein UVH3 isoform X2 [Tarenaya hassleriana]|uniref:DNA repair protein UVH3 isoform X2 n=1 Tax=Tarenaya hassleriana TaxID=28532 RepID=UPI00053C4B70|nr:PREDICTED: DNA repair protein UVH3 isoform X2 [Tarenaya hassleriana]